MQREYIIIGRPLTNQELSRFAPEDRSPITQAEPMFLGGRPEEEVFGILANFGVLLAQSAVQCPVGPHDDPGLAARGALTCSLGPSLHYDFSFFLLWLALFCISSPLLSFPSYAACKQVGSLATETTLVF